MDQPDLLHISFVNLGNFRIKYDYLVQLFTSFFFVSFLPFYRGHSFLFQKPRLLLIG